MRYYTLAIISAKLEKLYTYQYEKKIDKFTIVKAIFNNREILALVVDEVKKPDFKCNNIQEITPSYLSEKNYEIAVFIAKYYISTLSQVLGIFYFQDKLLEQNKTQKILLGDEPILSDAQNEALVFCMKNPYSLLFGDTGSGKTEIYIKAIFDTLSKNKTVIFLMPEISLTPQIEIRLKEYFKDYVAIWHSKLSKKKRNIILEQVQKNEIKVIAGARSALFLPMKDVGLIIVDEEHDDAYKSMNTPAYNAKDMSIYFGKIHKAIVILGSATPSLISYQKYPHFRLKGGYFKSSRKFAFIENSINESEFIINEIKQTYENKKQTILFVPTKANFQYLICQDCKEVISCPNCSITLSLYTNKNAMICHYCNYTQITPACCPSCKAYKLSSKNIGTSEVVKILSDCMPKAVIEQFDRNEITTDTKLRNILKKFNKGDIDILVGTQMIAKGHDYHNVSLAVILNIDCILNMQDYRSREKALSMFLQISGRAGRKDDAKVIVQTLNKDFFDHYKEDYDAFLKDELAYREDLYPPYKKIARILFCDKNALKAKIQMQNMQQLLCNVDDIEVVGFGESPIFKIAQKYRYYIYLRADSVSSLIKAIHKNQVTNCTVDIDPVNFV